MLSTISIRHSGSCHWPSQNKSVNNVCIKKMLFFKWQRYVYSRIFINVYINVLKNNLCINYYNWRRLFHSNQWYTIIYNCFLYQSWHKNIITMSMWGNVKRERCLIIAWFDIKQIKCFAYNTCNGNYFPFRLSYTCISNSK